MMRWDWVNDTSGEMRVEQKGLRRARRHQMIAEADAVMGEVDGDEEDDDDDDDEEETDPRFAAPPLNVADHAVLGVDEEANDAIEFMEEDSSDDSEDADSSDDDENSGDESSAASDEYAWGDHVSGRNAFVFDHNSDSSDDDGSDEEGTDGVEGRRRGAMLRARRSILQFLRHH